MHWKTLSTEHFLIHFHQGGQELAERTAEVAERVYARLTQYIEWAPEEKTHIVINDSIEIANALSTPLPYNTIIIYPTQPVLGIGHFEEWIEAMLIHEYTHILDIDRAQGFSSVLRKVIGRFWFPKLFVSSLFTEGFAVHNETYHTSGGRGRDPFTDMFLRMAFLSGTVPSLDQLSGFWDGWPAGSAPYIYGMAFYRFIAEKYGAIAPQAFQRNMADDIWPWNANSAARISTLHSMRELWENWKREAAEKYHLQAATIQKQGIMESQQFTTSGFFKWNPVWDIAGDAIYYFEANLDTYPAIRRIDLRARKIKSVMRIHTTTEYPAFSISPDGERLVVPQSTFYRSSSVYNDLWVKNIKSGKIKRLTRRLRASDAAWSPDGGAILFVTKEQGKTGLMKISPTSKAVHPVIPFSSMVFSEPEWSLDGGSFAVSVWQGGGYQDTWIFSSDGTSGQPLIHDKAWDVSPCWTRGGEYVIFSSDRTGVYNLFALKLETDQLYQVTNVVGGAFDPSVSPDGARIAFVAYSTSGFDIHVMPLDETKWRLWEGFKVQCSRVQELSLQPLNFQSLNILRKGEYSVPPRIKSYNPLSTLLPRFWLPYPASDESGLALAAATAGRDVLGKHTLVTEAQYGILSRRFGYLLNYVNDQFYPSLSFFLWNYPGVVQPLEWDTGYWYWSKGGSMLIRIPYVTTARQQWFTLGLERQRVALHDIGSLGTLPRAPTPFVGKLADAFVGWDFDNSHRYPMSISSTDGVRLSLAYRRYLSYLGSDFTFSEFTGDARAYIPLPLRRHVLAMRGGFMQNDMDLLRFHPEFSFFTVRGFGDLYAGNILFGSAEYRFPVAEIQRGWGLWPIFFKRVHAGVFTDCALLSESYTGKYRISAGAEIRLDIILGNLFQSTFRAGLALPIEPRDNVRALIEIGDAF